MTTKNFEEAFTAMFGAPVKVLHVTCKAETCLRGGEHIWGGWREFPDGSGGETVCQKCGMGSAHSDLMMGDG